MVEIQNTEAIFLVRIIAINYFGLQSTIQSPDAAQTQVSVRSVQGSPLIVSETVQMYE